MFIFGFLNFLAPVGNPFFFSRLSKIHQLLDIFIIPPLLYRSPLGTSVHQFSHARTLHSKEQSQRKPAMISFK